MSDYPFHTRLGCLRSGPEILRYAPQAWPKFAPEPQFAPELDLEPLMPPVYDQGNLGACTANAIGAALEYVDHYQPGLRNLGFQPRPAPFTTPSRLYLYYNGRAEYGQEQLDWGLSIPGCIDAICRYGIAPETDWPYDVTQFSVKPPQQAYASGDKERLTMMPRRIAPDIRMVKTVLSFGYPVVFGLSIENYFIQYVTDIINGQRVIKMPRAPYTTVGEHALVIVGWSDKLRAFKVRNSWTKDWGEGGYCWIPYEYVLNLLYAFDFFYIWGVSQ